MKAPTPDNEAQRLRALRDYEILDTDTEQAFEDLTLLAAHICQVPTAMVSFVDSERQWFKSKRGFAANETTRDAAFCAHTILHSDRVMEIRDAKTDSRFADNPLVTGDTQVRFYAGAPLVSPSGLALGALCVMDNQPRSLTDEQRAALQALSRRVMDQLELRRKAREVEQRSSETRRLLDLAEKSRRTLLGILEDSQQTSTELRESEERFRDLAGSIDEVFWMAPADRSRILYVSPAFEKIWGISCDVIYANPQCWAEAIVPEDAARIREAVKTKQLTGEYQEEYRIVRPDGVIRWIRDRAFPVRNAEGKVHRIAGVAQDITESKKLQEQFLRAQRMEAIGTLAGGIAHDLNNILAPVLMVSGLLRPKLKDAQDLRALEMVESSARRGAAIIRQLLMFSRGVEGDRVRIQLKHLLKDMLGIMRETFPREIVIRDDSDHDLWPVLGDATQLHQVIMNLCVNARDAMSHGGTLALGARNLELTTVEAQGHSAAHPGPYVCITVTDTGEGIPPEIINRIFDPFFTTKEVGKGTGLGLSTVLGIVENHGGFVAVRSEVGKGSVFDCYLPPASTDEGSTAPHALSLPPQGHGELILVVDDESHVAAATCLVLEKNGYRVLSASNGREGLARLVENQDKIALVLTDVMMPVMGGVALARALRAIQPELKIIATTGLDRQSQLAELNEYGVTEVLVKPCEPPDLLAAIARQLEAR